MTYTQILCLVFIALLVLWGVGQYWNSRPDRPYGVGCDCGFGLFRLKDELSLRAPELHLKVGPMRLADALQEVRKAVGLPPANGSDLIYESISEICAHIIATDWRE